MHDTSWPVIHMFSTEWSQICSNSGKFGYHLLGMWMTGQEMSLPWTHKNFTSSPDESAGLDWGGVSGEPPFTNI